MMCSVGDRVKSPTTSTCCEFVENAIEATAKSSRVPRKRDLRNQERLTRPKFAPTPTPIRRLHRPHARLPTSSGPLVRLPRLSGVEALLVVRTISLNLLRRFSLNAFSQL